MPVDMFSASTSVMLVVCSLCLLMSSCSADIERRPGKPVQEWPVLCEPRTFYSLKMNTCLKCSSCPRNQIIESPCDDFHDTKCGPLYDLKSLISAAMDGNTLTAQQAAFGLHGQHSASSKTRSSSSLDKDGNEADTNVNGQRIGLNEAGQLAVGLISDWKSLAVFACSAVVLVAVILIVGIYCIRRKMLNVSKVYEYNKAPPMEV